MGGRWLRELIFVMLALTWDHLDDNGRGKRTSSSFFLSGDQPPIALSVCSGGRSLTSISCFWDIISRSCYKTSLDFPGTTEVARFWHFPPFPIFLSIQYYLKVKLALIVSPGCLLSFTVIHTLLVFLLKWPHLHWLLDEPIHSWRHELSFYLAKSLGCASHYLCFSVSD